MTGCHCPSLSAAPAATPLPSGEAAMDLQPEGRPGYNPSESWEVVLKKTQCQPQVEPQPLPSIEMKHRPLEETHPLQRHLPQLPSSPSQASASNLGRGMRSGGQALDTLQPLEEASPSPFKTVVFYSFYEYNDLPWGNKCLEMKLPIAYLGSPKNAQKKKKKKEAFTVHSGLDVSFPAVCHQQSERQEKVSLL